MGLTVVLMAGGAAAQVAPEGGSRLVPAHASEELASAQVVAFQSTEGRRSRRARGLESVVRFGSDYTLPAGNRVSEVVVMSGRATIDGEVTGDLVVVVGAATLSSSASVGGDLVVVGGNLSVADGAVADGDLVVVGGSFEAPPNFVPGGEQVLVGFPVGRINVEAALPWLISDPVDYVRGRPQANAANTRTTTRIRPSARRAL